MARQYLVQIGSIYLTNNGLVGGARCKSVINGLGTMKPDKRRNIVKSISGKPYTQFFSGKEGSDIEIINDWMSQSVYDSIVGVINDVDDDEAPVAVSISGDPGTFNFNAVFNDPPIEFDSFSNGIIKKVTIRLVVT